MKASMKTTKAVLGMLIAFGLTGCETQPVKLNDSREVIPSHTLGQPADVATSMQQGGKIVVTRDKGWVGSAGLLKIFVDSTPVAKLSRYERYEVLLKEGDHLLGVAPNANPFGVSIHETSVTVKSGQTYYFRVGLDASNSLLIQRSAFTK
jgi:hypothetical protein